MRHVLLACLALAAAPRAASADKLDDAYDRADRTWTHYEQLRSTYELMHGKWAEIWKPLDDQQAVWTAALASANQICDTKGKATAECRDATLKYAAERKKWDSLQYRANELDPKHADTTDALRVFDVDLQKAKRDAEAARDDAIRLFRDAFKHAKTKADVDKLAAKLDAGEQRRAAAATANRSTAADAKNPSPSGPANGGSSGASGMGRSATYDSLKTNGFHP